MVEADAQLLGSGGQGLEGVTSPGAVLGARAEADVALADAEPGAELGRVVVSGSSGWARTVSKAALLARALAISSSSAR